MTQPTESAPSVEARDDSSQKTGESDARAPVMTPRMHRALRVLMFAVLALNAALLARACTRSYLIPATGEPGGHAIHASGICLFSVCFAECREGNDRSVLVTDRNQTRLPIAIVYTFGEEPPIYCAPRDREGPQ